VLKYFYLLLLYTGMGFSPLFLLSQNLIINEINKHLQYTPRFVFSFDSRNTIIAGQNSRIFGIRPALEFNERLRLGVGLYSLNSRIDRVIEVPSDIATQAPDTFPAKVRFSYASIFAEYAFFQSRHWEFGFPVSLGLGSTGYAYHSGENNKAKLLHLKSIFLVETAIYGQYRVVPWMAMHLSVGYRQMLIRNKLVAGTFSGPTYTLGVKIFLGKMYRGIFPKKDKTIE